MYDKLAGMTGTADTEAAEFSHIYELDVVVVPTNKPMISEGHARPGLQEREGQVPRGRSTTSSSRTRAASRSWSAPPASRSPRWSASLLRERNLDFEVLNAKQHEREAGIVAQAGRKGAITISTNMAGRGTDIILGGNAEYMARQTIEAEGGEDEGDRYEQLLEKLKAECDAERDEVLAAGGLKIIGTERHESRRIDNQLRGRAGRQGDPGGSRFYLSLEDDLLRIFGADRISGLMERLGMEEDVPIESGLVSRSIENAQKKVEGQNFDQRKNVLEYDDVMNQQRKTIYALRRQILSGLYAPELSEEDQKAGKTLPPPPTESGDWTVDGLAEEATLEIQTMVEAAKAEEARRVAQAATAGEIDPDGKSADGKSAGAAAEGAEADADDDDDDQQAASELDGPPVWRQLRAQIWRQTGAWLWDLEKHYKKPTDELVAYVTHEVGSSLVQQRERIYDLCDELVASLVAQFCPPGTHSDDWDWEGLEEAILDQFAIDAKLKHTLSSADEVAEQLWKALEKRLDERLTELSRPWLMYFARHFALEEIDHQWIDHLKAMEHLREGIGLRGYGQLDPKKEYKKEGYELFAQMMQTMQVNTARKLFRVQIQRQEAEIPAMQARQRRIVASHAAASTTSGADNQAESSDEGGSAAYGKAADGGAQVEKVKTVRREQPKVGRNDPCPCGSGKKYKKCHGREDSAQAI